MTNSIAISNPFGFLSVGTPKANCLYNSYLWRKLLLVSKLVTLLTLAHSLELGRHRCIMENEHGKESTEERVT